MSVNVIIVGSPRSGTSMTAAIFKNRGYFVTENEENQLQQANEYNPYGFWEAESLKKCNAEVFKAAGFECENTWLFDAISDQQTEKILSLTPSKAHKELIAQFEEHTPWLWKDPSLCYTIGYWWPLLKQSNTKVILLKRDPKEIHQSFLRLRWNNDDKQASFRRIEHHMKTAEHAMQQYNIPHIVVNYSDYALNSKETARKISQFFQLELSENDLGYDRKLRTNGYRGKYLRLLNSFGDLMPDELRKKIKKMIPAFIMKIIYPHRFIK
ncbi:MAG: sulfotransferase [Gammaproteobacteria bacterium]|nr:sulfotransferase [Gammaproteobacteria bacterium]